LSASEIKTVVNNAIKKYNDDELAKFKSTFKKSRLQYYIENAERSITGSDITIYMQKRLTLTPNQTKNYKINFNAPLKKGDFIEKVYSFPQFTVVDSSLVLRQVYIEEVPNSFTGIDSINITNAGTNYYSVPTITISGDGSGAAAIAEVTGDGRIRSITVTSSGVNYSRATVTITGEGSEASAVPVLEARYGLLRTFYYKDNGEKVIINNTAGTIDYNTGRLELNSVIPLAIGANDFYDTDVVTVNVVPNSDIIYPLRNRILAIDENNYQSIQVEVVAES
jgi:hypothetical protein